MILSLILSILSALVLSYGINLPFGGHHDWNSVMYSQIARNHLRYGLFQTKLGMVTNYGQLGPGEQLGFFTHYPPLMPLLLALDFKLFGEVEWSARLVPILSSILLIFTLTYLAQKFWNRPTAVFTAVLATTSPMLLYYSKIPVHETVILGFLGLTFLNYFKWLNSHRLKDFWLTFTSLLLSQLTGWAGFYLSLYLPLHTLIFAPQFFHRFRKLFLIIFSLAPILFLLHNLHVHFLTGPQAQQSLWQVFLFRLNLGPSAQPYHLTLTKFLSGQIRWLPLFFTRIMIILSLIWWLKLFLRLFRYQRILISDSLLVLLAVFGFTHNLIFRHLAFIHDYMLIYALPFLALSAAVVLGKLYHRLDRHFPLNILAALTLLLLMTIEKVNLVNILFHSGDTNPAVPLGKAIAKQTPPSDTILVLNTQFMKYHDVFIRYYADRHITAADSLATINLQNINYIALPKGFPPPSATESAFLYEHFSHTDSAGGTVFNLAQKL